MLRAPEALLTRLGASRRRPTNPYGFLLCQAEDTGVILYWTLVGDGVPTLSP